MLIDWFEAPLALTRESPFAPMVMLSSPVLPMTLMPENVVKVDRSTVVVFAVLSTVTPLGLPLNESVPEMVDVMVRVLLLFVKTQLRLLMLVAPDKVRLTAFDETDTAMFCACRLIDKMNEISKRMCWGFFRVICMLQVMSLSKFFTCFERALGVFWD